MANELLLLVPLADMDDDILLDLLAYALTLDTDKESIDNMKQELKRRDLHPVH